MVFNFLSRSIITGYFPQETEIGGDPPPRDPPPRDSPSRDSEPNSIADQTFREFNKPRISVSSDRPPVIANHESEFPVKARPPQVEDQENLPLVNGSEPPAEFQFTTVHPRDRNRQPTPPQDVPRERPLWDRPPREMLDSRTTVNPRGVDHRNREPRRDDPRNGPRSPSRRDPRDTRGPRDRGRDPRYSGELNGPDGRDPHPRDVPRSRESSGDPRGRPDPRDHRYRGERREDARDRRSDPRDREHPRMKGDPNIRPSSRDGPRGDDHKDRRDDPRDRRDRRPDTRDRRSDPRYDPRDRRNDPRDDPRDRRDPRRDQRSDRPPPRDRRDDPRPRDGPPTGPPPPPPLTELPDVGFDDTPEPFQPIDLAPPEKKDPVYTQINWLTKKRASSPPPKEYSPKDAEISTPVDPRWSRSSPEPDEAAMIVEDLDELNILPVSLELQVPTFTLHRIVAFIVTIFNYFIPDV